MVELECELGKDGVELSEEDWAEKLSPCLVQENNNNPNSIHVRGHENSGYNFNHWNNSMQSFLLNSRNLLLGFGGLPCFLDYSTPLFSSHP